MDKVRHPPKILYQLEKVNKIAEIIWECQFV